MKCGFEEQCKQRNLTPQVCSTDIKPIASTEVLLGKKYKQVWDTKVPSGLLLLSWLFFSLWWGWRKKKNKNASGKTFILLIISYSSTLHCLRSFIAWSLHIVHEKKRKFSLKKKANLWNICSWNLQSKTSFPFTADAFPASEKDIIVIHDVWSYDPISAQSFEASKDNDTIFWTMVQSLEQWQRHHCELHGWEEAVYKDIAPEYSSHQEFAVQKLCEPEMGVNEVTKTQQVTYFSSNWWQMLSS